MNFSRQICLSEIGVEGQEKLKKARVVCVGMGGLGCPAMQYLVAAGVGQCVLVDGDTVEASNLPRQILFYPQDEGRLKVEVARERLRELNPLVHIEIVPEMLNAKNAWGVFKGADLIIDGTDNFPSKFLINDAAIQSRLPVVWGAASEWDGQVTVFWADRGPCYRCLFPEPPRATVGNCAEAGVLGPVPGIIGIFQALEAIKLILGNNSARPALGELLNISGRDMDVFRTHIPKRPNCNCHRPQEIELVDVPLVTVCEARRSLADECVWIDVRESNEYSKGFIPGARNIPLSELEYSLANVDLPGISTRAIAYCQTGKRSQRAVEILQSNGFVNVSSLDGGYDAWSCKA